MKTTYTVSYAQMDPAAIAIVYGIALVMLVLVIIARWRLFTKAGEKGWKAIIPIYNSYTMYKLTWNTKMFWIMFICAMLGCVLAGFGIGLAGTAAAKSGAAIAGLACMGIGYIAVVAALVIDIISLWWLCKSYGKGGGFFVGMLLLTNIFLLILGFGKSQYIGPKGEPQGRMGGGMPPQGGMPQQMPMGQPMPQQQPPMPQQMPPRQ